MNIFRGKILFDRNLENSYISLNLNGLITITIYFINYHTQRIFLSSGLFFSKDVLLLLRRLLKSTFKKPFLLPIYNYVRSIMYALSFGCVAIKGIRVIQGYFPFDNSALIYKKNPDPQHSQRVGTTSLNVAMLGCHGKISSYILTYEVNWTLQLGII